MMRFSLTIVPPLAWLAAMLALDGGAACADGGRLVHVEAVGGYRASIFVAPNPLRAGPVDVSVLLQDAASGLIVDDAQIAASLTARDRPTFAVSAPATRAAATNKLLYAAPLELPTAGEWDASVRCLVDGESFDVRFALRAAEPLPRWLALWASIFWPLGAVGLFAVHRTLVWRHSRRRWADG